MRPDPAIQRKFSRAYNGHPNVMTPYLVGHRELPDGRSVELSWGTWIRSPSSPPSGKMYGVTVLTADGQPDHDASDGGFTTEAAALAYIDTLTGD